MNTAIYCPQCGARRLGSFRFCRQCGLDFDSGEIASPIVFRKDPQASVVGSPRVPELAETGGPPTSQHNAGTLAILGGVAWLACAAAIGYLALLQFGYVGSVLDDGSLQGTAIWNGISAALTLYFGARLLTGPTRGLLGTSAAWGALTVVWQVFNISRGATHETYLVATLAAGMAAVLSLAARQQMRPNSEQVGS